MTDPQTPATCPGCADWLNNATPHVNHDPQTPATEAGRPINEHERGCPDCLRVIIEEHGFTVTIREYVEDSLTPGFLGQIAGRTSHDDRTVVIGTHNADRDEIAARLAHELRHVREPGWLCGSRSPVR